ncbi:hypothetical protein, partial [Geobacillus sp. BMUD]|uniref:hypothetical protein n=1 Tax=Geobacillus sp. BMUD TaxID=2508876 RepID=UPI001C0E90BE
PMSHSEIIHKKFSTFFRKGGEGYSEGMCKKESFLCGNKVIIYRWLQENHLQADLNREILRKINERG